jgi:hypothetical protein
MGNSQVTLNNKSLIKFTIYFEPSCEDEDISISELSIHNIEKMINYYSSKYFIFTFDKILKNDVLKYKIISVKYDNEVFTVDGEITLKHQVSNIDISFDSIDTYIKRNIQENENDFKLKIEDVELNTTINLVVANIEYDYNNPNENNKTDTNTSTITKSKNHVVKLIKPRRQNELHEKERVLNKDFKLRR